MHTIIYQQTITGKVIHLVLVLLTYTFFCRHQSVLSEKGTWVNEDILRGLLAVATMNVPGLTAIWIAAVRRCPLGTACGVLLSLSVVHSPSLLL